MVLDANILVRAVLGSRVLQLLHRYGNQIDFSSPDSAFREAREHLPGILERRKTPSGPAIETLDLLYNSIKVIGPETYGLFESIARQRLARRDEDDWPILATGLALQCPIWTEDMDFFGCGVATWTTDRIEMYLCAAAAC